MTATLLQAVIAPLATAGTIATQAMFPGTVASTINSYEHTAHEIEIVREDSSLDRWINQLIQKESEGKTNIKILDSNGRHSYGCLQFQMRTFIAYGEKYKLFETDNEDTLEKLIFDCRMQKKLAKLMILEDRDNWRHWYTSVATRKLGLPPREVAQGK